MRKHILAAAVLALGFSQATFAGSVAGFGGSTEITQILNNVELLQQTAQGAQQIEQVIQQTQMEVQQLKNLVAAPQMIWGQVTSDLNQLTQSVAQGAALGYSLGNIETKFASTYKGYTPPVAGSYGSQARALTEASMDSIHAALTNAGVQANMFTNENSSMEAIQQMGATAPGQLQAAQIGIMVGTQQVQQMQKLRQLFIAQGQAQNAVLLKQEQKDATMDVNLDAHYTPYVRQPSTFHSKGGVN